MFLYKIFKIRITLSTNQINNEFVLIEKYDHHDVLKILSPNYLRGTVEMKMNESRIQKKIEHCPCHKLLGHIEVYFFKKNNLQHWK